MVKPAEDRVRTNDSDPLNRTKNRRIWRRCGEGVRERPRWLLSSAGRDAHKEGMKAAPPVVPDVFSARQASAT
jgi:hypothetical protein